MSRQRKELPFVKQHLKAQVEMVEVLKAAKEEKDVTIMIESKKLEAMQVMASVILGEAKVKQIIAEVMAELTGKD